MSRWSMVALPEVHGRILAGPDSKGESAGEWWRSRLGGLPARQRRARASPAAGPRPLDAASAEPATTGAQYACKDYRAVLARHGITQSMSRKGDCWGRVGGW